MSDQTMWWGYLHRDGSIQAKRWFGDEKDYTSDCEGNPFVLQVVRPFQANNRDEAIERIQKCLNISPTV